MQELELTEKHKKQLLEMCNKLFPEKPNKVIKGSFVLFCTVNPWYDENNNIKPLALHWFELCLLHIAPKLADLIQQAIDKDTDEDDPIEYKYDWSEWCTSEGVVSCIFHYMNQDNMHPIDILYKEFKLLKLK